MKYFIFVIILLTSHIYGNAQISIIGTWRPISIKHLNAKLIPPFDDNIIKIDSSKDFQNGDITFSRDSTFHIFSDSSKNFSKLTNWFLGISIDGSWKTGKNPILQFQYLRKNDNDNIYILSYHITKLTASDLEIVYHVHDKNDSTIISFKRIG